MTPKMQEAGLGGAVISLGIAAAAALSVCCAGIAAGVRGIGYA